MPPQIPSGFASQVNSIFSGSGSGAGSALGSWMPAIGAGLDAAGGFLGGLFNANQARKNRQFQERMYHQQIADNIKFWNMQNEYNLPSAQLQRLKDAGLNPLLMYGDGASGMVAASPIQSGSAPHGAQGSMSAHTNFGQALLQQQLLQAQIRNINADSSQKEQAAVESQSRTYGIDLQNWITDQTKHVEVLLKHDQHDLANQSIAESRNRVFQSTMITSAEVANLSLQNSLAIQQMELNMYQVGVNCYVAIQELANHKLMASAAVQQAAAAWQHAINETNILPWQIGLLREQAANYYEQSESIRQKRPHEVLSMKKYNSWYDLIQSQSYLNADQQRALMRLQGANIANQNENYYMEHIMLPLIGTGANVAGSFKSSPTPVTSNNWNGYHYNFGQ